MAIKRFTNFNSLAWEYKRKSKNITKTKKLIIIKYKQTNKQTKTKWIKKLIKIIGNDNSNDFHENNRIRK